MGKFNWEVGNARENSSINVCDRETKDRVTGHL